MKGIIAILFSVTYSLSGLCQFELNEAPLKVDVVYEKKDSMLIVSYQNTSKQDLALWVGDWMIDFIANDYNYTFLARPIKSSIFLYNKRTLREHVFNYNSNTDTMGLLSFKGYKFIEKGEKVVLRIKDNGTLWKQGIRKLKAWITYSVIDIDYMSLFLMNYMNIKLCRPSNCDFNTDSRLFTDSEIIINNVDWPFLKKQDKTKLSSIDMPFVPDPMRITRVIKLGNENNEPKISPSISLVELFHKSFVVNVSIMSR